MTQLPTPIEEQSAPSLFDRTIDNLRSAWRDIAAFSREAVGATPRPHLPREDADRLRIQMQACLAGRGGEVSAGSCRRTGADISGARLDRPPEFPQRAGP
jgi:malonyl-CoA decarboxylase